MTIKGMSDINMSIFDREAFEDAVNHDMIIYKEVLDIIQTARLNWKNSIMKGDVEGYNKNRMNQLRTAINEGLVTDLKVETFKQAYLNGLEAQKERVVKKKFLQRKAMNKRLFAIRQGLKCRHSKIILTGKV